MSVCTCTHIKLNSNLVHNNRYYSHPNQGVPFSLLGQRTSWQALVVSHQAPPSEFVADLSSDRHMVAHEQHTPASALLHEGL